MSTLRKIIDNRINEISSSILYADGSDDDVEFIGCSQELNFIYLLEEEKFIEIIEKYYDEVKDGNLSNFLCESIQLGFSIADSKCVVQFLLNEELDYDRVYFTFIKTNEEEANENISSFSEEQNYNFVEVIDTNESKYYFEMHYLTTEDIGDEPQQNIVLDSNLINTTKFVKSFLGELGDCKLENSSSEFEVFIEGLDSFEKLNVYSYDRDKLELCFFKNVTVIKGDAASVEDCFLILKSTLKNVYDITDKANILECIKSKIKTFEDRFKLIYINRLRLSSPTLLELTNNQVFNVENILNINFQDFKKDTLLELLSAIDALDFSMPNELITKMMRKLKPAQESIVRHRYFGDKILTLEEVGHLYNITRERVRQLEKKSIHIFNSPKNQSLRSRIVSQMQFFSTYDNFITIEDLERFGINIGIAIFLAKCLDDIDYAADWNLFFFNGGLLKRFENVLVEIPTEFTANELNFYAEYIADVLDYSMSISEISYLLTCKYKRYGDFYSTGKLKQKTILSYLMMQYFPNGIDLYDDESLNLVREKAKIHFDGFELSGNNRAITSRLQAFCVPIERGVWKFDIDKPLINGELLEQIKHYINNYNSSIVPISAVFSAFKNEFLELDITNKYYLQGQLKKVLPIGFKINRDYIYSGEADSFYKIIEEYIKQSYTIVTKRDILKQFPGVSDIVIQQVVTNTKVVNMFGYFVHLDNLQITNKEFVKFYQLVDSVIKDNSIYHAKTIFQAIKGEMSGLFLRIGVNHYLQFFYLFRELFPNDYNYTRPFMAKLGVEIINGEAQVLQRLQGMQEIKLVTLREIAKNVGTIIDRYIEFADRNNDLILIKDRDTFISTEYLEMDESMFDDLDSILSQYLNENNYKSLSLFLDYWKLPKLKIKWTDWLLYSVINLYSKQFKTAVSSNYIADAIPIVVRNEFDANDINADDVSEMEKIDVDYFADDDDIIDELDIEDFE